VGVNCVHPSIVSAAVSVVSDALGAEPVAIVVYPNRGELWDAEHKRWYVKSKSEVEVAADGAGKSECGAFTPTKAEWLELVARWHAAGASMVGGCCRTRPSTIAWMHAWRMARFAPSHENSMSVDKAGVV